MTTTTAPETPNRLYFGDNLDILRQYVADESVDLIYLDPPFNSNATYNVLFRERSGEESAAQITAFEDTWHWGWESETAFQDVVTRGPDKVGSLLAALRQFLGQNDMMAYLTMMAQRMIELHRVLKPTGSIYLHCDPTANPNWFRSPVQSFASEFIQPRQVYAVEGFQNRAGHSNGSPCNANRLGLEHQPTNCVEHFLVACWLRRLVWVCLRRELVHR